ncbi:uncharacterized protein [Nicotiana sylvestris]|uniref:uncharacterized protein n=1 Tax=Nicotiana sylvestris TaxID=4096 RepID=UPI00388CAC27
MDGLHELILEKAHNSQYYIHLSAAKMYQDLWQHYWCRRMKKDIVAYIARFLNCQQIKNEHQRNGGLLQKIEIPEWKWDGITMDFVVRLPWTQRKFDPLCIDAGWWKLKIHEKNYPVHDLELASIVHAEDIEYEHQRPGGLLQKIEILEWKWDRITMDFVVGLPRTQMKFDAIWVIMDRLTKSAYFIHVAVSYSSEQLAEIYICEIMDALDKVKIIQDRLRTAQSMQKSCADCKVRDVAFMVRERVLLRVFPMRGVMRFGKKGKLSLRFIEPFEILDRVEEVAYRITLPPCL